MEWSPCVAKILFLAHRFPFPPDKGDKIRAFHMLRQLAARHEVWLGAPIDDAADLSRLDPAALVCVDVLCPWLGPGRRALNMARALFTGDPLSVARFRHPELDRWIDRVLQEVRPDLVVLYSSALGERLLGRPPDGLPLLVDFVDADAAKWAAYAAAAPWPLSWLFRRETRKLIAFESALLARADSALLVSDAERQVMARLQPQWAAKLGVMSNGVDLEAFPPAPPASGSLIVMCGRMDYRANVEGARWFAHEVFPLIRRRAPEAIFRIVGAAPTPAVRALARQPGIEVTGAVPKVWPHLAEARVVVAPLRFARGIQNKVLEGLATARPVAATTAALEGLEVVPGREALAADEPATFAEAVLQVLEGNAPSDLGSRGREFVEHRHQWDVQLRKLDDLVERMTASRSGKTAAEPGRDGVGDRQGQAAPRLDHGPIPGIGRVDVGHAVGADQPVVVGDRTRLEPPVALEAEGPGSALAAPEVEHGAPAVGGPSHQLPIHQVVGSERPGLGNAAGIVG
jgi:sugar transferase (PEP-CTERM/EpsH1 system associated)